jgi:hypothetical protein
LLQKCMQIFRPFSSLNGMKIFCTVVVKCMQFSCQSGCLNFTKPGMDTALQRDSPKPYSRINNRTDRRTMYYNVTLWRVHETIVAVEEQYVLHICVWVGARECMSVRASVGVGVAARVWACVFARVALINLHATRMLRIACSLCCSTVFFDITS